MPKLIDREPLLEAMRDCEAVTHSVGYSDMIAIIEDIPTIDAKPVRHGRWIFGSSKTSCWMTCSICCKSQSGQTATFSYCPNCGARMDGGADNADN